MKTNTLALIALFFLGCQFVFSQEELVLTSKDSIVQSSWIFGLGFNAVDDSGDELEDLFDIENEWNIVPFPSRISIGRYFKNGLGLEAIASYNKYKEGKIIDARINDSDKDYFAFDARLSYDLNKIIGETGWFDPYLGVGIGYTDANESGRGTFNGTAGFRTWFNDKWGLDFNTTGKWAFDTDNASNHIQHAAGVVYRFDVVKGLSKKGEEKLALINAMEQEKQRVADSIAAVRAEEEARALAERLEREKEAARLAAEEKAKQDAENARRQGILDAIERLGNVYFALNSSYLNEDSKAVLDQLAVILEENPGLSLNIDSHTDSRGTNEYNNWLSEKRAKRTVDYLISKGVATDRLGGAGLGEEQLTNHCKDGVYCTPKEHRANRRSEFKVTKF